MARKRITQRTPERLIRLAYELERLASNLDYEGFEREAAGVRSMASKSGDIGRSLADTLKV